MNIAIREARVSDIARLQVVRRAVKENVLSNPGLVTDDDCHSFITQRGKGWVAVANNDIVGFAIADLQADNIWALFLLPEWEARGIGKRLHDTMLDWYFDQGKTSVWLSTGPQTRAVGFYRKQHWQMTGTLASGEIKFEMTRDEWNGQKHNS